MNRDLHSGKAVFGMLKETASNWVEDNALRLSAALAYYSIFSIAPLLVIAIGLAGWAGAVLGPDTVTNGIYRELGGIVGQQTAEVLQSMVESASKPGTSKFATIIGLVTLLVGASGIFGQLKDALNTIWEVKAKAGLGVKGFLRDRLLSSGMVLVIGFLLLVSLILTAGLSAFSGALEHSLPLPNWFWAIVGFLISFGVVTVLFALIFKVLPDVKVEWRNVWIGAVVTALLFEIGKFLLGLYLGRESTSSSYGAAAAVVLLLLWVYYASCILLFGAEFTQVYAKASGHAIQPGKFAEPVTPEARLQQGLTPEKAEPEGMVKLQIIPTPWEPEPEPAVPFPRTLEEVPAYLRGNPAASLLVAMGFGFAAGYVPRLMPEREQRTPTQEIAHGSRALMLAALPLAAGLAHKAVSEAKAWIRLKDIVKAARQFNIPLGSLLRRWME